MRTFRVLLAAAALTVALAALPHRSDAALTLPATPMQVHSYGFEGTGWKNSGPFTPSYEAHWTVGKNPLPPAGVLATYIWGPEPSTGARRSGSYGLWCSAYDTSTGWYSFNYATYLTNTSGRAVLALPELANYYSAELKFWYRMPSRGAADTGSFVLAWGPPPLDYDTWASDSSFPLVSSWTQLTYDLSSEISRASGQIWWEFNNKVEGGSQYPTAGHGPALDDVQVLGYMYGPVRELQADSAATGVELTWKRPYRAVNSTTAEERSIEYRVWRRPQAAPGDPWTELTDGAPVTSAVTDVTYTDSTATQGVTYDYAVVTYGAGSTTTYGESRQATGRFMTAEVDVQASVSPETIAAGDTATYTYRVTNTGVVTLTNVTVTDDWGAVSGSPLASLAPGAYHDFTRTRQPSGTETAHVSVTADGVADPSTDAVVLTVVNPGISIDVSPAVRWANAGKPADFEIVVTNTGDTDLTDITVNLGGSLATIDSLPAGGPSQTLPLSKAVNADSTVNASVSAEYLPGETVTDSDSVYIDVTPSRVAGSDRILTAIEASERLYPDGILSPNAEGERSVVIATGYDFPDALSASALAGAAGGPLLLVKQGFVSQAVLDELVRLDASKVYIVGGTAVVSQLVETTLVNNSLEVERIAGTNRYATAQLVAAEVKRLVELGPGSIDTVFLATGTNFPDALAASSLAAAMPAPVLLTRPTLLPDQTKAALSAIQPSTVVICGGEAAVSSAVESQIAGNALYGSPVVERQPGANRYATAQLIIEWGLENGLEQTAGADGVFLATGEGYPDALAGGALAGGADGMWRPLMLTKPTALSSQAQAVIVGLDHTSFVTVIGGTAAVSDTVKNSALGLIQ